MHEIQNILSALGLNRILLAIIAVSSIVLCFFADTSLEPIGWGLIFGVVVPAIPPLLFMVYGLDLLMSRVWRHEFGEAQVKRYDCIAVFNITVMLLLLIVWLPVFLRNQL